MNPTGTSAARRGTRALPSGNASALFLVRMKACGRSAAPECARSTGVRSTPPVSAPVTDMWRGALTQGEQQADHLRPRVDRSGPASRRHRPSAGHGRRAEGRQRPPGHGDGPRSRRLPALPEAHAARPGRPRLDGPRPVRPLRGPLQPDSLHPALPGRATAWRSRTWRRSAPGAARPPATPSTATPWASRRPPGRWARASPTRSAWRWPPATSAACSTPTPRRVSSPFDHTIWAFASDGDLQEGISARGVLARGPPEARQPGR